MISLLESLRHLKRMSACKVFRQSVKHFRLFMYSACPAGLLRKSLNLQGAFLDLGDSSVPRSVVVGAIVVRPLWVLFPWLAKLHNSLREQHG